MTRDLDLLVLVAPNGLGHFRRQVGILSRLLERLPDLRLHVLCANFQVASTADWDRAARFFADPRVTWTGGILDPGIAWSTEASRYEDGMLLGWMDRCRMFPEVDRARAVLSDNLGTVLALRPDTILAGSFLWGDVLSRAHPASEPVRKFAEFEAELLQRYRPPMLCVRDMAMPAVLRDTTPISLGWMCEERVVPPPKSPGRPIVAVLGGATGSANALLTRVAGALARTGEYELVLPSGYHSGTDNDAIFRHSPTDYARLAVAVCRPGIGTATDCIAQGVPMVTLHEGPINPELSHNGVRLQDLRVAIDLGTDPGDQSVVAAVGEAVRPETNNRMRSSLGTLQRDGLAEAVSYLAARLERGTA